MLSEYFPMLGSLPSAAKMTMDDSPTMDIGKKLSLGLSGKWSCQR